MHIIESSVIGTLEGQLGVPVFKPYLPTSHTIHPVDFARGLGMKALNERPDATSVVLCKRDKMIMVRHDCPRLQLPTILFRSVEQGVLSKVAMSIGGQKGHFVKCGGCDYVGRTRGKVMRRAVMPFALWCVSVHKLCRVR